MRRRRSGMPPRLGPGHSRHGEVHASRADILTVRRNVMRVYENVHLLADEGIVEFDALDLRPSLAILDELTGERPE